MLPVLRDVVIILGLSVLIILLFHRFRIPSILGFLITGIIIGPFGLTLINTSHQVEVFAEIGVIFLMFLIGIEFSIKSLMAIRNTVIWGGLFQVGLTILVICYLGMIFGLSLKEAIFTGFLFSLSSTAIVIKVLHDRGEISTPHGRIAVGILIFQDIIVIPMMLITPLLAGTSTEPGIMILLLVAKVIGVIIVVFLLARYIVPVIFKLVVKSRSREMFLITVILLCLSIAWLTSSIGLSLALGAFFAGLIISDSPYSHQATANILPFREIFISFFFVSVGMLLDLRFFMQNILSVHLLALGSLMIKALIACTAALILRYPLRTALMTGLTLFQVGEFAFLLSATGMKYQLLSQNVYQYFMAISIISMGATPLIMTHSRKISEFIIKIPLSQRVKKRLDAFVKARTQTIEKIDELKDHLIIVGYGINGENVAKAAKSAKIPYVIIETDPVIFRKAQGNNEPILFGDAADEIILKHVRIQHSRVVVIAISDPGTTKKIVSRIREFTDGTYIIVRTRYIKEIEDNLKLGADEVIPEEFETSIEIFTRVLKKYLIPSNEIEVFVNHFRTDNYELLRRAGSSLEPGAFHIDIPDFQIAILEVQRYESRIVGKSVKESNLRQDFGVNILAIRRNNKFITQVSPDITIELYDILYLMGNPEQIAKLNIILHL